MKVKDTKEIVLFFKENTTFPPVSVANEMKNRYEELGDPLVLPENEKTGGTLFVFNQNPSFQMQCRKDHFTIVVDHTYFEKITSIVFDMIDAFSEYSCEFKRIGYISNVFLSPKYIETMKKKYLKVEEFEEVDDINMGWHREIMVKDTHVNCWERMITDQHHFKDLLCQYDFNTSVSEEILLDMKYIKAFFKAANETIESRTDF